MANRRSGSENPLAVIAKNFKSTERNLDGLRLSDEYKTWKRNANSLIKKMVGSDTRDPNWLLDKFPYGLRVWVGLDRSPSTVIQRRIGEIEGTYLNLQNHIGQIAADSKKEIENNELINNLVKKLTDNPSDQEAYNQLEELIRGTDQELATNPEAEEAIAQARQKILKIEGPESLVTNLLEQADRALRFNAPTIAIAETAIVEAVKLSDELKADRKLLTDTLPALDSAHRGALDILEAAKLNITSDQFVEERMGDSVKALEEAAKAIIIARKRRAPNSELNHQLADHFNRARLALTTPTMGAKRLAATAEAKSEEENK